MKLADLESLVRDELVDERVEVAKEILKSRIIEIEKAEKVLAKLKSKYTDLLNKSVEEVVDEVENGNIRY